MNTLSAEASPELIPAIRRLAFVALLGLLAGCGSKSDTPPAQPAALSPAQASAPAEKNRPSQSTAPAKVRAEAPAPAAAVTIKAPTEAQIKAWTPAVVEPLHLLGVQEWEKTSFTTCVAPAGDGKHFLVGGSRVLLWALDGDAPEHVFLDLEPAAEDRTILALAVSPDGKWFVATDSTGTARIWSLEDRREILTKKLHTNGLTDVAISPDGAEIATISYDNEVQTWSADKLDKRRAFEVDTNSLNNIEYAAPSVLAVAGESTSLWSTSDGKLIQQLSPGRYSRTLARSPDAAVLLHGGEDVLRAWNIADKKEAGLFTDSVSGSELVAFSPDGKLLATSNGNSIRIWDIASQRVVQVIDGYGATLVGLVWLADTNLLVAASDEGLTRLWGTAAAGEKLAMKPTDEKAEVAIDLRTFPRLPGAETTMTSARDYSGAIADPAILAREFYHYFLTKAGWKLSDAQSPNPAATDYVKNGARLTLSCYDSGDGKTMVMLHNDGDLDARNVPRSDGATTEYASADTVHYQSNADLISLETELLRKLSQAGWTPYARLNASHSEQPDQRDLEFLKDGVTLRVSIGKFPVNPDKYTIQYSLFPNDAFVPVPPDAGYIEFDGSTEPVLIALSGLSLNDAVAFYDRAMAAAGWTPRQHGRSLKDEQAWVTYLRGQCDVGLSLTKLEDGRTLVRAGSAVDSLWENSLPKKQEDEASVGKPGGLEAADFPVVEGAAPTVFDANAKSLEITLKKSTLAAAAEKFIAALGALGWQAEKGGIRDEEYTMIDFKNGDQEMTFRARSKDGDAVVNIQGDGLAWNKPTSSDKQLISYEAWLRQSKLPPSLEFLDRYEAAMR